METIDSDILQVFTRLLYNPEPLFSHEVGNGPSLDSFKAYIQKHDLLSAVDFHYWDYRQDKPQTLFSDLLKHHVMELPADGQPTHGTKLTVTDKPRLLQFINNYITAFEKGMLSESDGTKCLSYKAHLNLLPRIWGKLFANPKLAVLSNANDAYRLSPNLRYFELALSLAKNDYLHIESCDFRRLETIPSESAPAIHTTSLFFKLLFHTSPKEILNRYEKDARGFFPRPQPAGLTRKPSLAAFDDASATITIGDQKVILTPNTTQHAVCREMFRRKPNTWISYDEIYEKVIGHKINKPTEKEIRSIRDAIININTHVRKQRRTESNLFDWKNSCIIRNL